MRFDYVQAPQWPPLAWLARLPGSAHRPGTEAEVLVTHGRAVETRDDWFGEIAWAGDELWIVSTRFSCLCTLNPDYSFVPRWRPPFVSALTAEDRCHLNGLALVAGQPGYVTALGVSDTRDGWRDVKIGLFCKRELGASATPEEWDERNLPGPTVRTVTAAIEGCDEFGVRLRAESDRLGVTSSSDVTVLGDGAEWIWNLADLHFPRAVQIVDLYHARQHLWELARALYPNDPVNQRACTNRHQKRLLDKGKIDGFYDHAVPWIRHRQDAARIAGRRIHTGPDDFVSN